MKKLVLLFLVFFVFGKKEVYPDTKADKKPKYVSGELYCNACQGVVRELLRKLRHRTGEADVIAAMEDICNMWHYTAYDFPPPEFKKGCEAFTGYYSEDLERALVNRKKLDIDVETHFCHEITKACVEVFWEHIPGEGINAAEPPTPLKKAETDVSELIEEPDKVQDKHEDL